MSILLSVSQKEWQPSLWSTDECGPGRGWYPRLSILPAPWRPTAGSQNLGPGGPGGLACMEQSGLQRALCPPHLVESGFGNNQESEPVSLL